MTCPDCYGDGIERCNNPDHGFTNAVGGELGRLGCPVCGHDEQHRVFGSKCPTCNGTGVVETDNSMCMGIGCEVSDKCLRYTRKPDDKQHFAEYEGCYGGKDPINNCNGYIKMED